MERIAFNRPSWRSVNDMWNFLDYDRPWAPDVTRYEGATPNFIGALSPPTSIGGLGQAGIARIGEHILTLTERLVEGLQRKRSLSAARARSIGSRKRIAAAGFVTTNRPSGIRVCAHGYDTLDEIDALLEVI